MYTRPTNTDLAFGTELGIGRFCTTLAINGYAVKRLRDVTYECGDVDTAAVEMLRVREGTHRLAIAGVPHLSIVDEWVQGNSTYYVQPLAPSPEMWTEDMVAQAIVLSEAAFKAGVGDIIPENIGIVGGELVIIDPGELRDPDDETDQELFAEAVFFLNAVMND